MNRKAILLLALAVAFLLFIPQARADEVLVSAPGTGPGYFGMYCNTCAAASFTLTGTYDVSTIDVVLFTPTGSAFTTFDFSLQSSVTSPVTPIATASVTAGSGITTEALNISEVLSAGTYYLVGNVPGYAGTNPTTNGVDGWVVSNGTYDDAAGTITDGIWEGGPIVFSLDPRYPSLAFTVNGSPAGMPETSTISLLGMGLAGIFGLAFFSRRRLLNS